MKSYEQLINIKNLKKGDLFINNGNEQHSDCTLIYLGTRRSRWGGIRGYIFYLCEIKEELAYYPIHKKINGKLQSFIRIEPMYKFY